MPNSFRQFLPRTQTSGYLFLCLASFALGSVISLGLVFVIFPTEPDALHSLVLWKQVNAHGYDWLREWQFTQDNWLLSLIPFHFILFWLVGADTDVVILSGWLIFFLSAVVSGLIAYSLGAKLSSIIAPVILINMGLYAHEHGYASYANSHNMTNLVGLLSFYLLTTWIGTRKHFLLLLIGVLNILGGISDPWLIPAYTIPFSLVALFFSVTEKNYSLRLRYRYFFVTMLITGIVIKTQVFGLFDFLPKINYNFASFDVARSNAIYFVRDLGGLYNLIPTIATNELLPAIVSLGLIGTLFLISVTHELRVNHQKSESPLLVQNSISHLHRIIAAIRLQNLSIASDLNGADPGKVAPSGLLIALSMITIASSFILSSTIASDFGARFLVNILYLGVVFSTIYVEIRWHVLTSWSRRLWLATAFLFICAGLSTTIRPSLASGYKANDRAAVELMEFLSANNLNYGYGSYWKAQANSITALSDSKITIRPVAFTRDGKIIFGRAQTSRFWYTEDDFPVGQKRFFVIVARDKKGSCAIPKTCVDGLISQFGTPNDTIYFNDLAVLVWNKPLFGSYLQLSLGDKLFLDSLHDSAIWRGWSYPESIGTWSLGNRTEIKVTLSHAGAEDVEFVLSGRAHLDHINSTQDVDVLVNDNLLTTLRYDHLNNGDRTVVIPRTVFAQGNKRISILLSVKNPMSSADAGLSGDTRRLGILVSSIEFGPARR